MNGYKRGADLMVEQATGQRPDRDRLVFPIIFNYRQYLELSLKYLISSYGLAVGVSPIWNSHSLSQLWTRFTHVLDHYGATDDDGATVAVAKIVAEYARVDPMSFSFRYPVDTQGRAIELAHDYLDLAALADVMRGWRGSSKAVTAISMRSRVQASSWRLMEVDQEADLPNFGNESDPVGAWLPSGCVSAPR